MPSFIVDYIAFHKNGDVLQQGKIRAKNRRNEADAENQFRLYLQRTLTGVERIYVGSVTLEMGRSVTDDFLSLLGMK